MLWARALQSPKRISSWLVEDWCQDRDEQQVIEPPPARQAVKAYAETDKQSNLQAHMEEPMCVERCGGDNRQEFTDMQPLVLSVARLSGERVLVNC